jgi:UDP-N-acetylmuramoylalanine--D-glutamate ligase
MAEAAAAFRGVEHRIEFVASAGGVDYFNDSKATNVDSAIKAVESFEKNLIVILGGLDKGAPYDPLIDAMRGKVKHLILIGEAAAKIEQASAGLFPTMRAESMEAAVERAAAVSAAGDVVLLSPACASFDMFDNYEHRGRVFKHAVRELANRCREH